LSHGNVDGRKIVIEILDAGLESADPYDNTRKLIELDGETLYFYGRKLSPQHENLECDLSKIQHIYVIGAGKAA